MGKKLINKPASEDNKKVNGRIMDPQQDAAGFMGDTRGIPGTQGISRSISDAATRKAKAIAADPDTPDDNLGQYEEENELQSSPPIITEEDASGNETLNEAFSPHVKGEQEFNASTPDPASDDDTLQNEKKVGLRLKDTEEHREELDIASDLDEAEEYQRTH